MARTIAEIQAQIISQKEATPELDGLTSPSEVSKWRLWTFIQATAIALFEQILDIFKIELESIAAKAVPGTASWWQAKVLEFQFSATDPQVIQLIDFAPRYPVINTALRIITRASIKQDGNRVIGIKVAKGIFPAITALTADELNALKDYLNKIKFAGTELNIVSLDADRVRVAATVYYEGQYVESTVKTNVIAAIEAFFASLTFDGVMYNSELVNAIQSVEGVKDVVLTEVRARTSAQSLSDSIAISRYYEARAGYIIGEDTTLNTLNDTIIMSLNNI